MMELSAEQQDVVAAPLAPLCVIACAGSGKTRTAVHRLAELRRRLDADRGRVALLSFSNVAVDTFRTSYAALASRLPNTTARSRVEIDTVDGFITSHVLRPHAHRSMGAAKAAYLVSGEEPFLQGFTIPAKPFPRPISSLRVGLRMGAYYFFHAYFDAVTELDGPASLKLIQRLAQTGAYTHELGRYWCLRTLQEQPELLRVLAHRYPHILVDESQDIGALHRAILDLLAAAGSQITLIGDPNQGIYEFAGADGDYLASHAKQPNVKVFGLTRNYRSIPAITTIANGLSTRSDETERAHRAAPHGAYVVPYASGKENALLSRFGVALTTAGLRPANSAVVCRAIKLAGELSGVGTPVGVGAIKGLAKAAILRDERQDYLEAFQQVAGVVATLLAKPPAGFVTQVSQPDRYPEMIVARRLIWAFTRSPERGLPSAALPADTEWHPQLCLRLRALLVALSSSAGLATGDNLGQRLAKKGLDSNPVFTLTEGQAGDARLRIDTVHQVKGESLDGVLYIATKPQIEAMLAGVGTEEGRIGYVAVTRATDLLWLGVPEKAFKAVRPQLLERGFAELPNEPA
ncbi:MAG: ATP-dependent helicase [Pseudomonadota bacterium]